MNGRHSPLESSEQRDTDTFDPLQVTRDKALSLANFKPTGDGPWQQPWIVYLATLLLAPRENPPENPLIQRITSHLNPRRRGMRGRRPS